MKRIVALLLAVATVTSMTAPAIAISSEASEIDSSMASYGVCEAVVLEQGNQDEVKPDQAKKVARDFLDVVSDKNKYDEKFEEWQNAKISKTTILFGVDNDKKSYLFRLSAKGEYVGHVVVSATKDNYPILEFSKGKSPIDAAKEKGIDSQKAYRIQGMTYYFKDSGEYFDIHGKEVNFTKIQKGVEEAKEKPEVQKRMAKRAEKAREEWNERLNDNNDLSSSHMDYGSIKLTSRTGNVKWEDDIIKIVDNTVPLVQPSDALCAPTSAAMVLAYWDQSGYPAFPNNYNFDLVYDLEDIMGEWYVGPDTMADGINIYTDNKGYDSDWAHTETPDLYDSQLELYNGRPFNLHLWDATEPALDRTEDNEYDNHVIEVHGWTYIDGDYLIVYDTWDYEEHYFNWGAWWGATNIYVEPGWG